MSIKTVLFLMCLIIYSQCTKLRSQSKIIGFTQESDSFIQMISEFLAHDSVGLYSLDKSIWATCSAGSFSVDSPDYEEEQKFKLEKLDDGYYVFRNLLSGKLISIQGASVSCESDVIDRNSKFKIEAGPQDKQFYMSAHKTYLTTISPFTSNNKDNAVWNIAITKLANDNKPTSPANEDKPIEGLANDKIGLLNGKTRFFAGDNNGVFTIDSDSLKNKDNVEITLISNNYYTIKNIHYQKYLGIKDGLASWDFTDVNEFDKFKVIQYTDVKTDQPYFQLLIGSNYLSSEYPNFISADPKSPSTVWTIGSGIPTLGKYDSDRTCLLSFTSGKWISAKADKKIDNEATSCGTNEEFKISTNEYGLLVLTALFNQSLLSMKGDQTSVESGPVNVNNFFIVEFVGTIGLRLKSAVTGKYVSSTPSAFVNSNADDSTIFYSATVKPKAIASPIDKVNTGLYSIKNRVWASCQPDGELQIDRKWWREWEWINVNQSWKEGFFIIKSSQFNRFFGIENGKANFRESVEGAIGPAHYVQLEPVGSNFRIKVGDLYLSADNKPSYVTKEADKSTVFAFSSSEITPSVEPIERSGLFSPNIGMWASCQAGPVLEVNRPWYQGWEYITVEPSDKDDHFYFKSSQFNRYLSIIDGKAIFDDKKTDKAKFRVTDLPSKQFKIDIDGEYLNNVSPNFTTKDVNDKTTTIWTLRT